MEKRTAKSKVTVSWMPTNRVTPASARSEGTTVKDYDKPTDGDIDGVEVYSASDGWTILYMTCQSLLSLLLDFVVDENNRSMSDAARKSNDGMQDDVNADCVDVEVHRE